MLIIMIFRGLKHANTAVAFSLLLLVTFFPNLISSQGIVQSNSNKACSKLACHSSGVEIDLNLVEDKTVTFTTPSGNTVTYAGGSNGESWHGMADLRAANIITRQRSDGTETFTGSFVIKDNICRLNYRNGEQIISCRHESTFPPKMAPKKRKNNNNTRLNGRRTNINSNDNRYNDGNYKTSPSSTSSSSTIDIMVVWTEKAECALSFKNEGCKVNSSTKSTMEEHIDLAISETNTAYKTSEIYAKLNLVHAYREPDYVEKSDNAFGEALDDITNDGDGFMDDVHTKRTQYSADVVAMLIDDWQYCGLAWLGPENSQMFSVTGYDCATGIYVLGHEIGHNMGCNHDRGSEDHCRKNWYPEYNYGWRDPQGDWSTIMSYDCTPDECDKNPSNYCPTIQRFSSKTLKYEGKPLGDKFNDCSRQHNDVRTEVENYYPLSPVTSPPTVQQLCYDDLAWTFEDKDCGWVAKKISRCEVIGSFNIKAKDACPIACKMKSSCIIPKCYKNSEWEPTDGSFKDCSSIKGMNRKSKKKACAQRGTYDMPFGYVACKKCKKCKKK